MLPCPSEHLFWIVKIPNSKPFYNGGVWNSTKWQYKSFTPLFSGVCMICGHTVKQKKALKNWNLFDIYNKALKRRCKNITVPWINGKLTGSKLRDFPTTRKCSWHSAVTWAYPENPGSLCAVAFIFTSLNYSLNKINSQELLVLV